MRLVLVAVMLLLASCAQRMGMSLPAAHEFIDPTLINVKA